jgi:AcrR family transcriptional regulator
VGRVGIDTIVAASGCAKASLYNNFVSKDELAIAFLNRRDEIWTVNWLEAEVLRRAAEPEGRLLAIFDAFDDWFRREDFEGCSFINVLLESDVSSPVRKAAAQHLANVRAMVCALAEQAGLAEPESFSQVWHMLMKGSIVAAAEGNRNAAQSAGNAARVILEGWARHGVALAGAESAA